MIDSPEEFLEYFRIAKADFEKANISWDELVAIRDDFLLHRPVLQSTANAIAATLQSIDKVHSVRFRVKDPDHLLEKIVRKRRENPKRKITIENYKTELTDLIGARALHLFKADWETIHTGVKATWDLKEKPLAYIRRGDDATMFKAQGLTPKEHKAAYRSVHYILKTNATKETHFVELQVRTIFEEAWGEIDHQVRYPYFTDDPTLQLYCLLLNGMTGNADEMATLILQQREFQRVFVEMRGKQEESERTLEEKQREIDQLVEKYQMVDADKTQLSEILEENGRVTVHLSSSTDTTNLLAARSFASDALQVLKAMEQRRAEMMADAASITIRDVKKKRRRAHSTTQITSPLEDTSAEEGKNC